MDAGATVAVSVMSVPNAGLRFDEVTTVAVAAGTTVMDMGFDVDEAKSKLPE